MITKTCEAETVGQEHACTRCGYVWDINDPEPPKCKTKGELQAEKNRRSIARLKESLK